MAAPPEDDGEPFAGEGHESRSYEERRYVPEPARPAGGQHDDPWAEV
jgi:hypothetical protein